MIHHLRTNGAAHVLKCGLIRTSLSLSCGLGLWEGLAAMCALAWSEQLYRCAAIGDRWLPLAAIPHFVQSFWIRLVLSHFFFDITPCTGDYFLYPCFCRKLFDFPTPCGALLSRSGRTNFSWTVRSWSCSVNRFRPIVELYGPLWGLRQMARSWLSLLVFIPH